MNDKRSLSEGRCLVIDVGGTRTKWGVVTEGAIVARGSEVTPTGSLEVLLERIAELVGRFPGLPWALALPHEMDSEQGIWRDAFDLIGLKDDIPIVEVLKSRNLSPVLVASDLLVAAAGEAGGDSIGLIQVGTGLGLVVVESGKVLVSPEGLLLGAGLKHVQFREEGPSCPECGLIGCVFVYACLRGHWRRLGIPPDADVDPKVILERSEGGAAIETDIISQALDAWGFLAAMLIASCRVRTVRLAGGVVAAWEERARSSVPGHTFRRMTPRVSRGAQIEYSELRGDAPLLGLAELVTQHVRRNG